MLNKLNLKGYQNIDKLMQSEIVLVALEEAMKRTLRNYINLKYGMMRSEVYIKHFFLLYQRKLFQPRARTNL